MSELGCARCGHLNAGGANFCSSCGHNMAPSSATPAEAAPAASAAGGASPAELTDTLRMDLEAANTGEMSEIPAPASGAAEFVVKRGAKAGSRFMLDSSLTTIGRHPESTIFLNDITVSRRHADVRFADGGFFVSDAGSLNGTYLNRERVEESPLNSGDELQVGKFKLVFLFEEST